MFAAVSMGQRIDQYGWTPERIWGVVAVGVAITYGAAGWWAASSRPRGFDDPLRPLQTQAGHRPVRPWPCSWRCRSSISARFSATSQVARLESGKVQAERIRLAAMAFDFGPDGRERLEEIARGGPPESAQTGAWQGRFSTKNRGDVSGKSSNRTVASANLAISPPAFRE